MRSAGDPEQGLGFEHPLDQDDRDRHQHDCQHRVGEAANRMSGTGRRALARPGRDPDAQADQGEAGELRGQQALAEEKEAEHDHERAVEIAEHAHATGAELVERAEIQGVGDADAERAAGDGGDDLPGREAAESPGRAAAGWPAAACPAPAGSSGSSVAAAAAWCPVADRAIRPIAQARALSNEHSSPKPAVTAISCLRQESPLADIVRWSVDSCHAFVMTHGLHDRQTPTRWRRTWCAWTSSSSWRAGCISAALRRTGWRAPWTRWRGGCGSMPRSGRIRPA